MKIKLALIQTDLIWERPEENLKKFDDLLNTIKNDVDIVILPEVFATGFSMNLKLFIKKIGKLSFEWLKNKAKEIDKIIVGSLLVEEGGNFYNRMYWMRPDGSYAFYDKRHLFQMGDEHKIMTAGEQRMLVDYKGVKFMLQICYDLRFPVFARNKYNKKEETHDYDALLYIANWPESRKDTYNVLLKARAIENQSYAIWVNRIGTDGHGVVFSGDSQVVDPYGKVIGQIEAHQENILYSEINIEDLKKFRAHYKVGLDWD